jgi:N-acetylneuraminic acid mutarotase
MKHLNSISFGLVITFVLAGCLATAARGATVFTLTGGMAHPRFDHSATLLPNGQVLVAGGMVSTYNILEFGFEGYVYLNSAELYDPATGTWSPTGSMGTIYGANTATLLPNGKVLCGNGSNWELYDPATGTWSPTGSPFNPIYGSATLLANGKVLCGDGSNWELYDPATGTWSPTGSPFNPIYGSATLLANGKVLVAGGFGTNDYPLASAELYDPATGVWTPTGSMETARGGHTATLLPNGKVLVVGGEDTNYSNLASAELYDPATGTWSPTGSLTYARAGQTATLLTNGLVLVYGGYIGGPVSAAELYDPATGTWSPTASEGSELYGHTATLLANGQVLIAGGQGDGTSAYIDEDGDYTDSSSVCELYDPTVLFVNTRSAHTATPLVNGQVLVAGGFDNNNFTLASAELFDPVTGVWTPTGNLANPRGNHTATLLTNGKVLVAGGQAEVYSYGGFSLEALGSAELYDPATGVWTSVGNMETGRYGHTATLLANGKVLVAGGFGGTNGYSNTYLSSAELYDPATGVWTPTGSMGTAREDHTATLLTNGKVLVAGGYNGAELASAELYDPTTGAWSPTRSLSSNRSGHTATLLTNGKVLVAGGDATGISAELYDPATANWTRTGSLAQPSAYDNTATLLANGKVLVSRGGNSSVEIYDPATGTWSLNGSLTTVRYGDTATLLASGLVLVVGGNNSGSFAELYDPLSSLNPILHPVILSDGSFQFFFSGNPGGTNYSVLASPDVAAPMNSWLNLGAATETPPGSGLFQFTDPQAPNYPQRFYRVTSP